MSGNSLPEQSSQGDDERALLKRLLAASSFALLRFSPALEEAFLVYHHERAMQHIRSNGLLIFPLVVLCGGPMVILGLVPVDVYPALFAVAALYLLLALGFIAMSHVDALQRFQRRLVEPLVAIGVLLILWLTTRVSSGETLYPILVAIVAVVNVIIFFLAPVPTRPVAISVAAAMLFFTTAVLVSGSAVELRPVMVAAGVGLLAGITVGVGQELRDRRMFLQERALHLEHQLVDALAKQMEQLSRTDALTGLMNRRHFEETLTREWGSCRRDAAPLGLLLLDVDHFKNYNDHYGHPAGDRCLAQVGKALASRLSRASDVVARYGGEEFVIVLPRSDAAEIARIAAHVLQAVEELALRHEASSCGEFVSVSIGGAACVPDAGSSPQVLLKMADEALYEAKRQGRRRFVLHGAAAAADS